MSEKIQRYDPESKCGCNIEHVDWEGGDWCKFTDVSILESRLAEAEKALAEERGVSSTTIAGCIKFEEENRALSARIRELEGALRPFVFELEDRRERWVAGEAAWDHVDEMRLVDARGVLSARALKGEG